MNELRWAIIKKGHVMIEIVYKMAGLLVRELFPASLVVST